MTLLASRLLTATVLRGQLSAFSLELPPYRMPRVGQVLVRSLLDRTLFVLGRAVTVAAPAGLLIEHQILHQFFYQCLHRIFLSYDLTDSLCTEILTLSTECT